MDLFHAIVSLSHYLKCNILVLNRVFSNGRTALHTAIENCPHGMRVKWIPGNQKLSVNNEIEMFGEYLWQPETIGEWCDWNVWWVSMATRNSRCIMRLKCSVSIYGNQKLLVNSEIDEIYIFIAFNFDDLCNVEHNFSPAHHVYCFFSLARNIHARKFGKWRYCHPHGEY